MKKSNLKNNWQNGKIMSGLLRKTDVTNSTMFNSLFHTLLKSLITKLKVCNITPFPLSFYTSRATFGATLKTKKPVNHCL